MGLITHTNTHTTSAGVYSRMFKFNITSEPGSDIAVTAVRTAEQHTIGLLRTVDMQPRTSDQHRVLVFLNRRSLISGTRSGQGR